MIKFATRRLFSATVEDALSGGWGVPLSRSITREPVNPSPFALEDEENPDASARLVVHVGKLFIPVDRQTIAPVVPLAR